MIIIPVKDGESIDRALKRFKKKFMKTGTMKELRNRREYTKKSVELRSQRIKAAYKEQLRREEDYPNILKTFSETLLNM